jgi:hypothetical protein
VKNYLLPSKKRKKGKKTGINKKIQSKGMRNSSSVLVSEPWFSGKGEKDKTIV